MDGEISDHLAQCRPSPIVNAIIHNGWTRGHSKPSYTEREKQFPGYSQRSLPEWGTRPVSRGEHTENTGAIHLPPSPSIIRSHPSLRPPHPPSSSFFFYLASISSDPSFTPRPPSSPMLLLRFLFLILPLHCCLRTRSLSVGLARYFHGPRPGSLSPHWATPDDVCGP